MSWISEPTADQRLAERIKEAEARLARLKTEAKTSGRASDTRRKILLGAVVWKRAREDERLRALLHDLLNAGLERERDRLLFGLPPRPAVVRDAPPAAAGGASAWAPTETEGAPHGW